MKDPVRIVKFVEDSHGFEVAVVFLNANKSVALTAARAADGLGVNDVPTHNLLVAYCTVYQAALKASLATIKRWGYSRMVMSYSHSHSNQ